MNSKEIQRRIKGIKNTKQITKAMEMVAASKMRKAVERVLATRSYANLAWKMLNNLSGRVNPELHPLLQEREIKKIGVILITSDRGLCGAMNAQVIQKAIKIIEKHKNPASGLRYSSEQKNTLLNNDKSNLTGQAETQFVGATLAVAQDTEKQEPKVEFISIGKKGRDFTKKYFKIFAEFTGFENVSKITEVIPIVKIAIEDYKKGIYDKIILVYTDFVSTLKQEPVVRQLLPLKQEELNKSDSLMQTEKNFNQSKKENQKIENTQFEYKFEPTPDEVLEGLLPRLLEIQIYQALLESNASEHCARMVAMKNATDAAKDLIDNLTMTFNQVRQASITQEITEISTGAQFV
ncbi:MAG: FoF1 ATP synthase subunit gamma [Candidatus Kuenenbacteria bacterium]